MEKMLCSGIPLTGSGNLVKSNTSLLNRHFQSFRPSRQHLDGVVRCQLNPDRYDIITLAFFIYARLDIPGEERLKLFLEETNAILAECGMSGLYPANAYEAFIMMCTCADCPLADYGDVWELSYSENGN